MYNKPTHLQKYLDDVHKVDSFFGIHSLDEPNTNNLMFFTVALCGEAGEFANMVKKIVRNGVTGYKMNRLMEEMADMLIYFCKVLDVIGGDFDAAWNTKHDVLIKERDARLRDYTIENKPLIDDSMVGDND